MKLLLVLSGVCVALLSMGTRADAQNYPWCAYYSGGDDGGGTNCGFTTFEQCMENRERARQQPNARPASRSPVCLGNELQVAVNFQRVLDPQCTEQRQVRLDLVVGLHERELAP